jgi:hypothetical protein
MFIPFQHILEAEHRFLQKEAIVWIFNVAGVNKKARMYFTRNARNALPILTDFGFSQNIFMKVPQYEI